MEKKDVIFLQISLCLQMERLIILDYLVGSKSHHDVQEGDSSDRHRGEYLKMLVLKIREIQT